MTASTPVAIRIRGLTKSFPGVAALRGIDLDILSGEVHGLVGENGAGKSTLIKHLTGLYTPDSGSIELFGRSLEHADTRAAQQAGIGVIYQERAILPELTAAANVFLGRQKRWGPFLNRRATIKTFCELADRLGVTLDPDARAGSLSVAGQQILEIMRALESEHRILIMDEPATSLGASERERLHGIVGSLRQQGLSIIFISHDLDEILGICDRVTVMRDGALVALTPKLFDTLLYLVENAGRLVEKDELMDAVWPGRFVEENNISQTIFHLRKALGDTGEEDRFIVTAPGRGYRFTPAVHLDTGAPAPDAGNAGSPAGR